MAKTNSIQFFFRLAGHWKFSCGQKGLRTSKTISSSMACTYKAHGKIVSDSDSRSRQQSRLEIREDAKG